MNVRALRSLFTATLLVGAGVGCGNAAKFPRYFEPPPRKSVTKTVAADAPRVRVGQVLAAPHLGSRMAWRISDVEVAYEDLNVWASPPSVMTQVAIQRVLFIERGFRQSGGAESAILSIEVTAFEGIQATREAHVELLVAVRDRTGDIHTQRFGAKHPAGGDDPADLATASGVALDEAIGRLARWLEANAATWTAPQPANDDDSAAGQGDSAKSAKSGASAGVDTAVTPQTPGLIDGLEQATPDRPRGRWAPAKPGVDDPPPEGGPSAEPASVPNPTP